MGVPTNDMAVSDTDSITYLPSEVGVLSGHTLDYEIPVLVLADGSIETRLSGTIEEIADLGTRIVQSAEAARQRGFEDATGYRRGEHVHVGKGETLWEIDSFSWGAGSENILYAHLKQVDGYNTTSAQVSRLTKLVEQ